MIQGKRFMVGNMVTGTPKRFPQIKLFKGILFIQWLRKSYMVVLWGTPLQLHETHEDAMANPMELK